MGWDNDFEVADVKIVRDFSYETVKRYFDEDVERLGFRKAVTNVTDQFDVLGQVNKAVGTSVFLLECDMAFEKLMNLYGSVVLNNGYYYLLKYRNQDATEIRKEWGLGCEEDMISKHKDDLKASIDYAYDRINHKSEELEEYGVFDETLIDSLEEEKILLNCEGGKSFFELFLRELESLTALYCKQIGKEMTAMRKNIYTTAYDYLDTWYNAENIKKRFSKNDIWSSLFRIAEAIDNHPFVRKIEDAIYASKNERLSRPYTYFADSIV